ncbi:MAG: RecX family transcriptional regulator [Bacteroidaceae bacterium]|nr:RecX family transcriptional regulator [Bacteroidaceae bacterium]
MTENEGFERAYRYCTAAEHCRSEVKAMLERHKTDVVSICHILDQLEKEKFIDEKRYARAFVHDKLLFSRWGRIRISYALRQKRIPEDVIEEAISSIDQDEYDAVLSDVADSFRRSVKGSTDYERNMYLMKRICSRGFEPSIVSRFLRFSDSPDNQ